jgi:hypothetical protein
MLAWIRRLFAALRREAEIPSPPFHACKRTGKIMYGLWYGRLSPDQAREKARAWGWTESSIEETIAEATQPPSYWSQHMPARGRLPVAIARHPQPARAITGDVAASRRRS